MHLNESLTFLVESQHDGKRLDSVLREMLPHIGTRGAKRLVNNSCATLDGKIVHASTRVAKGNIIKILPNTERQAVPRAKLIKQSGDFYFIFKPRKLHCAAIKGSKENSLEDMLPNLIFRETGQLLQRLDYETSGIVLATANNAAHDLFNKEQDAGRCQKRYLALVLGQLSKTITVTNALDTSHRKKSKVLAREADPIRHSIITPIKSWQGSSPLPWQIPDWSGNVYSDNCWINGITLVGCAIQKGSRHQIRAHASHAGFPLAGDMLYGKQNENGNFFLHQCWLSFAGHSCLCLPEWLDTESVNLASQWLETGKSII